MLYCPATDTLYMWYTCCTACCGGVKSKIIERKVSRITPWTDKHQIRTVDWKKFLFQYYGYLHT